MNSLIVLGKVVAQPVFKKTANDKQLSTFSVSIQPYKAEDSPWELAACAWGQTAAAAAEATPGALLILQGNLRLEKNRPPELQLSQFYKVGSQVDPPAGPNTITLVGRAGRYPEVRYFESGSVVANLALAVNRRSRDDEPDWFNLAIWGKQAQLAADYVRKGSLVGITGSVSLDRWTDRTSGEERSKPVIRVDRLELLGSRRDTDGAEGGLASEEIPF